MKQCLTSVVNSYVLVFITCTFSSDHNQDSNLVITDNQGMILLDSTYAKRMCLENC